MTVLPKNSREYHNIHKHYKIEQREDFIDELSVLLLFTIELAQIPLSLLHILVCLANITLDIIDKQLMHSYDIHRLSIHWWYLINWFLYLFVLPSGHLLHHFVLSWLEEMRFAEIYLSLAAILYCLFGRVRPFGVGKVNIFEFECSC